jgi:hypothetical protein
MRPITVFRACALVGTILCGATMVMVWGDNTIKGPPPQWERQTVGGLLLCAVALVALWSMGPAGARRAAIARGIALAAAGGAVALAFVMRQDAVSNGFAGLLAGGGWTWFLSGAGLCLGAAFGALSIKPVVAPASRAAPRRRRR